MKSNVGSFSKACIIGLPSHSSQHHDQTHTKVSFVIFYTKIDLISNIFKTMPYTIDTYIQMTVILIIPKPK